MENLLARIVINPDICHGKPVIRGMRYPVEFILELMASGMSHNEIIEDYPDLQVEDLLACIAYASNLMKIQGIYKIAS